MDVKTLIDDNRSLFAQDNTISPNRAIVYTPKLSGVPIALNAFIGIALLNKTERDMIGRFQSFGGLALTINPEVLDSVHYDGIDWTVRRYTKMGNLYTVVCENKQHNGRPQI